MARVMPSARSAISSPDPVVISMSPLVTRQHSAGIRIRMTHRTLAAVLAVFTERNRVGGDLSFLAFDLLELDGGKSVMREPWEHRRIRAM